MKRSLVLLLLAVATAATAQVKLTNIVTRQQAPTYSDVYCAGFVSNQGLQKAGFVAGGLGDAPPNPLRGPRLRLPGRQRVRGGNPVLAGSPGAGPQPL